MNIVMDKTTQYKEYISITTTNIKGTATLQFNLLLLHRPDKKNMCLSSCCVDRMLVHVTVDRAVVPIQHVLDVHCKILL